MGGDGTVRQLERRQLGGSGRCPQLVARALAQERDRVAVSRAHLVVIDPRTAKRLLNSATRMYPRAAVISVAHEQRRLVGHSLLRFLGTLRQGGLAPERAPAAPGRAGTRRLRGSNHNGVWRVKGGPTMTSRRRGPTHFMGPAPPFPPG